MVEAAFANNLVPLELTLVSDLLSVGFCLLIQEMWDEKDQ